MQLLHAATLTTIVVNVLQINLINALGEFTTKNFPIYFKILSKKIFFFERKKRSCKNYQKIIFGFFFFLEVFYLFLLNYENNLIE